jgi:hypothetical protein
MTRSSPLPSVQYETPRPESWRGETAARRPSRRLCVQMTSPVLPSSAGRIQDALDRERRPFELVFGPRTEVVGLEAPCDLELIEVRGVDLIERRVARAFHVGGVVRPIAGPRRRLTRRLRLQ